MTDIHTTRFDNEGSYTAWAVYPPQASNDDIAEDFDLEGHHAVRAGGWFRFPAHVRRTASRVLVSQVFGFDV